MNIIYEGLDGTGKSSLASKISEETGKILIDFNSHFQNIYNIDNFDLNLNLLNSIDNAVFDRHFLSLLVYWKITNKDFYDKNIDQKEVFDNFIDLNQWSILIFRYLNFEKSTKKIIWRKENMPEKISEHDINMLNKNYFYNYTRTFHDIYDDFSNYALKKGGIITYKENAGIWKNYTKKSLDKILKIL